MKQHTNDYVKRMFKDINTNLMRKFNLLFKMDENRKYRDWVTYEKPQIEELWQKCKARVEAYFPSFKYIKVEWDLAYTPGGDDD